MRDVKMDSIRAIDRAIDVVNAFRHQDSELTIEMITHRVKLPKATVYRVLYTLERRRWVTFNPQTLTYKLGLKFLEYADIVTANLDIRKEAEPILEALHEQVNQTVFLSIVEDDHLVYVYQKEVREGLKVSLFEGPQRPLVYGAFGLVSLAYLDESSQKTILSKPIPAFTPATVTDVSIIQERIRAIRSQRIYIERDEAIYGVTGIAAPVLNGQGKFVAAVGINGPTMTMVDTHLEECIKAVQAASEKISQKLGYASAK
ncbi:IclR family transcriptional regulator [Alicyclobacillus sp. TC]|uniref:Transcriptional regulator, IclR family n=1 Tax=Alicyclobacillus tolerans TaxID=90970 RepID=A0A1M6XY97_9BACL|nr:MULTISPECIES: IclR family transcriptional regulator [Alicyclobacillus]QRF22887.1 IclR family transcriptional regulator [Alicyclobacillus sp. TC]SHL10785.1 transcriptional regulator, IclR family [Alicyclobacillus montanus]